MIYVLLANVILFGLIGGYISQSLWGIPVGMVAGLLIFLEARAAHERDRENPKRGGR